MWRITEGAYGESEVLAAKVLTIRDAEEFLRQFRDRHRGQQFVKRLEVHATRRLLASEGQRDPEDHLGDSPMPIRVVCFACVCL